MQPACKTTFQRTYAKLKNYGLNTRRIPGLMTALTLTALMGLALSAQTAAHAQATQINDASGLSAGDTTLTYTGRPSSITTLPSYTGTAGGQTITLTDAGNSFLLVQQGAQINGAFPNGTNVLATTDTSTTAQDGPLTISFSSGVGEVGFSAQDVANDFDSFTFSAYDGATLLGTFSTPTVNNTINISGTLSFLGVSAGSGSVITSIVASSTSSNGGANDFFVGPLTFGSAAVTATPEPASYAAFAMGGFGLLGLGLKARKRTA